VAIISNVMLQYRPAPPPRTPTRRRLRRIPLMKILVYGAGAVGGFFGGLLAHAGKDVHFVAAR
jgi:hypothetical protein